MRPASLLELTIEEAAASIASRKVSPVELVEAALRQIEAVDGRLRGFITVLADSALEAAHAAEVQAQRREPLPPLHGIPLAVKDNIFTVGVRTTAGSKILADFVPDADAPVVAALKERGAIILGKTNLHEFAWGGTTDNPHYGTTRNPWNTDRFPSGSSGGSAVAVAARECWGALGTDTAGSIRVPAAVNGVVGLRPTIGRVSCDGIVPLAWSMDTVGPLCRTAGDCALLFATIAGVDPSPAGRNARGLRIGVDEAHCFDHVQPAVAASVRTAVSALEAAGAKAVPIRLPDMQGNVSAELTVTSAEASTYHQRWLRERPDDYGDDVRTALEAGELYLATHYLQAQRYRQLFRDAMLKVFDQVDGVLSPSLPFVAPPIGETQVVIAGDRPEPMMASVNQFTGIASLAGLPAISIPCGFSPEGLPIGLQMVARPFEEATLLRLGEAYQALTDWHRRTPPLA